MAMIAQTQARTTGPQGAFDAVRDYLKNGEIALAIGILAILVVLLLPLPPWLLDLALSFSITFAILILMTSVFIRKPLEFSSFPTILLISTMLRVALNLASTRLILAHGSEGTDAAGLVIQAFGRLITQGNFVIGIIVFSIIIGVAQQGMSFGAASQTFTLLTIGDGLVTQVPALIVSTAAGMMVSKAGIEGSAEKALFGQLSHYPQALAMAAFVMAVVAVLPGMPHVVFALIATGTGG